MRLYVLVYAFRFKMKFSILRMFRSVYASTRRTVFYKLEHSSYIAVTPCRERVYSTVTVQWGVKVKKLVRQNLSAARASAQRSRAAALRFAGGVSGAAEPRPKNWRMLRLDARSEASVCESRAGRPFVFSFCLPSGSVSVRARFLERSDVPSFSMSSSESSSPSDLHATNTIYVLSDFDLKFRILLVYRSSFLN